MNRGKLTGMGNSSMRLYGIDSVTHHTMSGYSTTEKRFKNNFVKDLKTI